eukprot:CAMPEP_0115837522 /NCGR_PEP_ID=MMETSP0287-20121206/5263_1 /TAXON_ID=412157 /ORGANISM="Chrysochromulina rotalis, Strain UIO044" /LENGTH=1712 /DNA_ID=CAMNT_0003291033 /DNA_START=37 /DNA_END=5176 /DNA_ORIENTATION=+
MEFDAHYLDDIKIGENIIALTRHPDFAYPGMRFKVTAFRDHDLSLVAPLSNLKVEFWGSLQLGPPGAVPTLISEGMIQWSDGGLAPTQAHLAVRSSRAWTPFAILPWLTLPIVLASLSHDPISFIFPGNMLKLHQWQVGIPSLSFSIADSTVQPELELVASGSILLDITGGFEPGKYFEAIVIGRYLSAEEKLDLSISHPGGWQPLPGIDITTPAFQGIMAFQPSGFSLVAAVQFPDRLVLLPGLIEIGGGDTGKIASFGLDTTVLDGDGPMLLLTADMPRNPETGKFGKLNIAPSLVASLCLPLTLEPTPHCGALDVGQDPANADRYRLAFALTGGGIQPLSGLPLPPFIIESVTVRADTDYPLTMEMGLNLKTGVFDFAFSAAVVLHLPMFFINNLVLDISAAGRISEEGMDGAFVVGLPEIGMPDALGGPLAGPAVALATSAGFEGRINGRMVPIRKGLSVIWTGVAPPWTLCADAHGFANIRLEFFLPSPTQLGGSFACDLDWSIDVRPLGLKGLNLVRFSGIYIALELAFSGGMTIFMEVGATFEFGTGTSMCDDLDDPQCLMAYVNARLGLKVLPPPVGGVIEFEAGIEGLLFEPLGMRNFAVIDPRMGLGLQISPLPNPPWVAIVPTLIMLNVNIYWKVFGEWPQMMFTKENSWPPDLLAPENVDPIWGQNLMGLQLSVLWEMAPHDDTALSVMGLPKIGIKVNINFKMVRLPQILMDMSMCILSVMEDFGIGLPPTIALPSFIDDLMPFEINLDVEFSLITTAPFGKRIFADGVVKNFDLMYFGAPGMWADIGVYINFPIPALSPTVLSDLLADPLGALSSTGIGLNMTTKLPFGLLAVTYGGFVSPIAFSLIAGASMNFFGFSYALSLFVGVDLGSESNPTGQGGGAGGFLGMSMAINIPLIATVHLTGMMTATLAGPGFYLEGAVDAALFGICMLGSVSIESQTMVFKAKITAHLGLLGSFELDGELSPEGYYLEGWYQAPPGPDPFAGVKRLMVEGIIKVVEVFASQFDLPADNPVREILEASLGPSGSSGSPLNVRWAKLSIASEGSPALYAAAGLTIAGVDQDFIFELDGFRRRSRSRSLRQVFGDVLRDDEFADDHDSWLPSIPTLPNSTKLMAMHSAGLIPNVGMHDKAGRRTGELEARRRLQTNACGGESGVFPSPFDAMDDFVGFFVDMFSFEALLSKIGPLDETLEFELNGLLDMSIMGFARLQITASDISLTFSGAVTFLGLGLSGSAELSTDGGIRQARLEGTGVLEKLCDACPEFNGFFLVEKAGVSSPVVLTMAVQSSFLGVSISGDAEFSTDGGIKSFSLEGDASPFIDGLKSAIRNGLAGVAPSSDLLINAINDALSLFYVSRFRIVNPENTVLVTYEFDVTIVGQPKTLKFKLPRLPTSIADLVELISFLASEIASSIAPFEMDVAFGDPNWDAQICLPEICWYDYECDCGHLHLPHHHDPHIHIPGFGRRAEDESSSPHNHAPHAKKRKLRGRIPEIDGPGDGSDMVEDVEGSWWQPYPGGEHYALAMNASLGDAHPHITGIDVKTYQEQIHVLLEDHVAAAHDDSPQMRRRALQAPGDRRQLCDCSFKGCSQLCATSPLIISMSGKLIVGTTSASMTMSVRVQISAGDLPGEWPSIDQTWSTSISMNFASPSRNLCDLVPPIRDFIETAKVGGGNICECLFDICLCIDLPELKLSDFLSCDLLGA